MKRALLACLMLAACVTPQGHQAFRQVMERQIGKQTEEPDFYPVYYRLRQVESKTLPNGNVEDEYLTGRRNECHVFFEATPGTRRVVRWRFEGDERYCVILPRER